MARPRKDFYSASDCSFIENEGEANLFLDFSQFFSEENIFSLSKKTAHDIDFTEAPFAYINYKDKKRYENKNRRIWTGRWIGRASYETEKGKIATIEVLPRFGNFSIFAMIEEAFSCNIVKNKGKQQTSTEKISLMDLLIPFIWSHKLSQANLYGVPHNIVEQRHKGPAIRGRLHVQKSIIPLFKEHQVVSVKKEKKIDEPITQIILQAYKKISGKIKTRLSPNAEDALNTFYSSRYPLRYISENEYKKIHYKPIYYSFKDVVDFSWQIIKAQKQSDTDGNIESFSGFLDMAEIWEIYLRSILRKNFSELGWTVESPVIDVYEDTFWNRKIIPDIVMTKGDYVVIFDAKWKKMEGKREKVEYSDLDRSDFFQIHSYIEYYRSIGKRVVLAGLLYPLDSKFSFGSGASESPLWGKDDSTTFIVDGVKFNNQDDNSKSQNKQEYENYKNQITKNAKELVFHIKIHLKKKNCL